MTHDILCADIGGTNSRFAHFEIQGEQIKLCSEFTCDTAKLHNTAEALKAAEQCGLSPYDAHAQIWGVAGLVDAHGLAAKLTNAPLQLDFTTIIPHKISKPFLLLNDFALQAWACLTPATNLMPIIKVESHPFRAIRGILGAGTGLGTATLIPKAQHSWGTLQAEGGHTDMPFYGKDELEFADFALKYLKQDRISAEDILAGRGLSLLHAYTYNEDTSPEQAIKKFWDIDGKENPQLQLYARFLGRFCKNWVLNTLCTGGLYLGGGVFMKNPNIFKSLHFLQEFHCATSSMQNVLKNTPVNLLTQKHAGLWGAAYAAQILFNR